MISKLFGQKLLIVLHYGNAYQLAIYETCLLKSDQKRKEEFSLKLNVLGLGNVQDNFVTQVSGIDVQDGNILVEQINVEAEKDKLRKQIAELKIKAHKEVQLKKKQDADIPVNWEIHSEQIIKDDDWDEKTPYLGYKFTFNAKSMGDSV